MATLSACKSKAVFSEEEVPDTALVQSEETTVSSDNASQEDCETTDCTVFVCGAVVNPDVYILEEGAVVKDALEEAGGFAEGAAREYINLAEPVKDGEKIYFPYESELEMSVFEYEEESISDRSGEGTATGRININTASMELLETLPGIGESKARSIIEYREEHGDFSNIEEIKNISGIKDGVYDKIKDYICVD